MTLEEVKAHARHLEDNCFKVDGHEGVAWYFDGEQTETVYVPVIDEDDEEYICDDYEERPTGMVKMVMVGDDRVFIIDPADCAPITDDEFCSSCGQLGCGWC